MRKVEKSELISGIKTFLEEFFAKIEKCYQ